MLVDTFHPFSAPDRPPARRRAGLTPKPHHAQQPRVALRGSFRLRLASTCNHRPARGAPRSVGAVAADRRGGGAPATADTVVAPARRNARDADANVAPVVTTSSTSSTR